MSKANLVMIITGNEPFFKNRQISQIISKCSDRHVEEYTGGQHDAEIQIALQTGPSPFMPMKKLIIIRELNKIKKPKFLNDYCEKPYDDRIVLLVTVDGGKDAKWVKDLPVKKTTDFEKIKDWDVAKWLVKEAKTRDLELSLQLAEAIVLNVGTELYTLSNELDKIRIYSSENKVNGNDVQSVLFGQSALTPFDILYQWGIANKHMAISYLVRHFEKIPDTNKKGSELVLLNLFLDRLENLISARTMKDRSESDSEIAKALDKSVWFYKNKIEDQVLKRPVKVLLKAYQDMCEIDEKIKTGADGYLLLQQFIYKY